MNVNSICTFGVKRKICREYLIIARLSRSLVLEKGQAF